MEYLQWTDSDHTSKYPKAATAGNGQAPKIRMDMAKYGITDGRDPHIDLFMNALTEKLRKKSKLTISAGTEPA